MAYPHTPGGALMPHTYEQAIEKRKRMRIGGAGGKRKAKQPTAAQVMESALRWRCWCGWRIVFADGSVVAQDVADWNDFLGLGESCTVAPTGAEIVAYLISSGVEGKIYGMRRFGEEPMLLYC